MATLSPQNAQKIAELKAQQQQAQSQLSNLVNSESYLEIKANNNNAVAERNAAIARLNATPIDSPDRQAAVDALEAAQNRSSQAFAEYAALKKQENALTAQVASYEKDIQQTAAVQTTSPEPTLEQQEAAANAAGGAAASQAIPNPPPPSSTVPPVPPYNPSLDNPLPNDTDPNFIPAPRPTTPSTTGIITADNIAEINATVNATPQYVLPAGSVVANAPGAVLNPDIVNSIAPEYAATVNQVNAFETALNPSSPGDIGNFLEADAQATRDQNAITAAGDIGNFQAADAAASAAANLPPLEQGVVTSPGDVGTLDITQSESQADDPLGDKIKELQTTNSQISTLPNRQQLSGTGSPKDWRFRISLAPSANYLYKDSNPGILRPLQATNGVIFPYSPSITVSYNASYSSADLIHTNYKIYNYKNSSIEGVNITGDFTAQDSAEANYVLAVIHFFKSVTKMFYGQDQNPQRGTPPPLVYLTGFGQYQFDQHPVVITSFTHTFPADVDYVNAYPTNNSVSTGSQNMQPYMPQIAQFISPLDRLRTLSSKIRPGGTAPPPTFINSQNINEVTRIPAKLTIQLTCLPIISRKAMSNAFSLQKYASGELMRGSVNFNKTGGGIW